MSPSSRTPSAAKEPRMELIVGDTEGRTSRLARDVERGLSKHPKSLPGRWMLDANGVEILRRLWRASTSYALAAERQLLADRAYAIPLYFQEDAPRVIEVGVVDARRTGAVLGPLLEAFGEIRYTAVGPDRAAVEAPCKALVDAHPGLHATAMVGRLADAVRDLRASSQPVVLYWPERGLDAMPRSEALETARDLGTSLRARDLLVATLDLRKDPRLVQRIYRDRNGLAKQLHLNVLERINAELGGRFDISNFRHRFSYDEEAGEMASELVSRRSQSVRIDDLDAEIEFSKGECVYMETLTRYSPQEIDTLALAAELTVHERWYDRDGRVCANLMRPA